MKSKWHLALKTLWKKRYSLLQAISLFIHNATPFLTLVRQNAALYANGLSHNS